MNEIYEQCRDAGLIRSQREFSGMWGRAESWFSSTVSRQERRISTEALLSFYFSLADVQFSADSVNGQKQVAVIGKMREELWKEISSRVRH
ncbi:MAG TPA: hypothetical protein HPP80_09225 [Rhodospirillaceae bacterium]|nr:hypothetical protein [Rhodospirillaceae bacterium]